METGVRVFVFGRSRMKHTPKDGSTHWSSRKLAAELGDVSFSAVQPIWRKHGLQPHRLERHLVSNDPDFETKAADVIGCT